MAVCEGCGNDYDKMMTIRIEGRVHVFDCFECAIHRLAPLCVNCGCRVIGHGMEGEGVTYCGAHCARTMKEKGLCDRVDIALI